MSIPLQIIIAFAILLTGCRSQHQKDKKPIVVPVETNRDSSSTTNEQTSFVAKLKPGIGSTKATVNDSVIFIVRPGDIFLYHWQSAWLADGRSAYVAPELVEKLNIPCFKFNFTKWKFKEEDDYELLLAAKRKGIDLNQLIQKIQQKDQNAFLEFYHLKDEVDAASSEEFPYDFWALLNLWNDQELWAFVRTMNDTDRRGFHELMMRSAPFANPEQYYELYYSVSIKLFDNN